MVPSGGSRSGDAKAALGKVVSQVNATIIALEQLTKTAHVAEASVPNNLRGEAAVVTAHINFAIGQLRKALHEAGSVNLKIQHGR